MDNWQVMKNYIIKMRNYLPFLLLSALFAGVLILLGELGLAVFTGRILSPPVLARIFLGLLVVFLLLGRRRWWVGPVLLAAAVVGLCVLFLLWRSFSRQAVYEIQDYPRELYADKTVMIIVPHEDDEANLMSGVTESYIANGSTVYVVFVTNGDRNISGQIRLREALRSLKVAGVPESNVIFLGYGDGASQDHLYNAPDDAVVTSYAGFSRVYGLPEHPAYSEGAEYTRSQLLSDLRGVLLAYRPDVIFCSDFDPHSDHKATSLAFEQVCGQLLRENPDYRPLVYKGFAYKSAWYAEADFYGENITATQDVFAAGQTPGIYRWEERVRFPVLGSALSRSLFSSQVFQSLGQHFSQKAWHRGASVVSGDRVFWLRRTDSVCYTAEITASSGDASLLADFMLLDSDDVTDGERMPYDGVWIPEESDALKTVTISLEEETRLTQLVLYDHPDPSNNILNIRVSLPDGRELDTGPLDPVGSATVIPLDDAVSDRLRLTITDWEGDCPGLSEIELFATEAPSVYMDKLQDAQGNFVYDYWTGPDGIAEFTLYAPAPGNKTLSWDNPACQATWDGEVLHLVCPQGEQCVVTLSDTDRVRVSNPTEWVRLRTEFWQKKEQQLLGKTSSILIVRIIDRILRELGKLP